MAGHFREVYLGAGQIPLILAVLGYLLAGSFRAGNPQPLPYIPLLNPIELLQVYALAALFQWYTQRTFESADDALRPAFAILAFVALNGAIARTVHHLADVPFESAALWNSAVFQTLLSIAWTTVAVVVMFGSNRTGLRREWQLGAILLAAAVIKLFIVDLADTGEITRIVSFLGVGGLILVIAYVSPLPPPEDVGSKRVDA